MTERHYRAAAAFHADFTGRTIEGKLVPFDSPREVSAPGFRGKEAFARTAFDHQTAAAHRVPLYLDHGPLGGKLIGRVDTLKAQHDGLYGKAIISDTADGRDALALIKDGVYRGLSIGFGDAGSTRQMDGTVLRTKVNMFELAVVQQGAYSDATIHALRTAGDRCSVCGQFGKDDSHTGGSDDPDDSEARSETPNQDVASKLLAGWKLLPLPELPV